ncbi:unnamed protein product, partial [Didymodactylos carnosus]
MSFKLIIMLLDDNDTVLSYEQLIFEPVRFACVPKFHIYLRYNTRPKIQNKHYFVRIDAFSISILNYVGYRASWYYNIPFTFLPVHKISLNMFIPAERVRCANTKCGEHGQCLKYVNQNEKYYCHCQPDWSGPLCQIQTDKCNRCLHHSICFDNEEICVCPLGKTGRSCRVPSSACQSNTCQNNGTCVPLDQRLLTKNFRCLCPDDYFGDHCETHRSIRRIKFDQSVQIPPVLLIYAKFLPTSDPIILFRRIPLYENSLSLQLDGQPSMVFGLISHAYYLIGLRNDYVLNTTIISTAVRLENRCPSFVELFNQTILKYHPLKRIKYYQEPCQQQQKLKCFYDETQICVCNRQSNTDCLPFNHNRTFDCNERNFCLNNGECIQDDKDCPLNYMCICPMCYHGTICQFATTGYSLSLDAIIGSYIRNDGGNQPFIINLSIVIVTVMFLIGVPTNLLSILTFCQKKPREYGCGIYLLSSSIVSLFTICLFTYKFFYLLITQIFLVTNRQFLLLSCILIEYLLKFLPIIVDWFNACVASERVFNVLLMTHFNKKISVCAAKFVSILVVLIAIISLIHDPFNRQIIDDLSQRRI